MEEVTEVHDLAHKSKMLESWHAALHQDGSSFMNSVLSYLAITSPRVYQEQVHSGIIKAIVNEDIYKCSIENYFEEFLFGPNVERGKNEIQTLNKPPQLCGKVFGVGDPTYTCKDCAADPTCVFCNECFRRSVHINHRYRLHTSAGMGGFCDCGDKEAWKQDPFCSLHEQGAAQTIDENVLDVLPQGFLNRARALYTIILQYCVDLLCWSENDNLPKELPINYSLKDGYTTMLFNDESHTYEDVISALCRAVECDRASALKFATIVDKQGRSLISSGDKDKCGKICKMAKDLTSRNGKHPLKCEVMHKNVVAHQLVGIRLLDWIYQISSVSDGLRRLLCLLSLHPINNRAECLLTQILKADTDLWKTARASCHQLFMNMILIDPYGKQEFAKIFVANYKTLMKDFIRDDHEHSISASSMSVQVFTVPTVAMKLITEHDVLKIVLETFFEHLEPAINCDNCIDFQSGASRVQLKRACYVLHDLGYLLHHKPEQWTSQLRTRFLSALDVILKILTAMQGMDSVVRKRDSHIEFEPNWESGFLLQFWIMPIIEDMLGWCTSDAFVLKKAVKKCITLLGKMKHKFVQKNNLEVEPGHITILYDVSSRPVTVHMPLTRFLAGLLTGCAKHDLTLQEVMRLDDVGVRGYLALMEFSLRALVLMAQVSARMWRRNGYAILNQVSYYQNVRCVSEMYDRDIIMLQVAAACMDPDHFLTALLDKYGLFDWIRLDYDEDLLDEDGQGRIIVLSEEFLLTVLAVLGERHVIGVGQVSSKDILQREVIHQLALEPASRSEIVKNLPCKDPDDDESCNFEAQLDDVLNTVAEFRKPGVTGKGLYELKKVYSSDCNQYFYHYTRSEQSKALEIRRKEAKKQQPLIFRPPPPPEFCKPFVPVSRILHCAKLSKLLAVIFLRALKGTSKITPETAIEEALHLIALGIQDENRDKLNGKQKEDSFFNVLTRTLGVIEGKSFTLLSLLQDLSVSKPKEEYSGLVAWILEESSHLHTSTGTEESVRLKADDDADLEKERRAKLAKEKREKVMAQISAMQRAFIQSNQQFLEIDEGDGRDDNEQYVPMETSQQVAVGPGRQNFKPRTENVICILCQEKQDVTAEGRTLVLAALIQRSKVLSGSRGKSLENETDYNPLFTPADLFTGTNVNSCGHVMHSDCWEEYFKSVVQKEGRHSLRFHHFSTFNVTKKEYLCPLCSSLCNTALPYLPAVSDFEGESNLEEYQTPIASGDATLSRLHQKLEEVTKQDEGEGPDISRETSKMLKTFCESVYLVGLRTHPDVNSPRFVTMTWGSCSYTIQCAEAWSFEEGKGLFGSLNKQQMSCIGSLVRQAATVWSISRIAIIKKHCSKLLGIFSPSEVAGVRTPSILELNIFGIMLNLRFALPALHGKPSQSKDQLLCPSKLDETVLRLGLQARIIQVLMSTSPDSVIEEDDEMSEENSEVVDAPSMRVAQLWGFVRFWMGLSDTPVLFEKPRKLLERINSCCQRFLRCCAIFFHFLTSVPVPESLDVVDEYDRKTEFQGLCSYLSVPMDLTVLFEDIIEAQEDTESLLMIKRWCQHEQLNSILNDAVELSLIFGPSQNKLIPLPTDYSLLINSASGFRCGITGDLSRTPAICLVCGEMLCSQSYCCQTSLDGKQVGSCTAHAHHCSDGVGIFLRIRECEIVLLFFTNKGCFMPSPYLDEYGEPDHGFRRGNPLFLSVERYNNLQRLWLSHGLPDEISRQMESSRRMLSYDWSQI